MGSLPHPERRPAFSYHLSEIARSTALRAEPRLEGAVRRLSSALVGRRLMRHSLAVAARLNVSLRSDFRGLPAFLRIYHFHVAHPLRIRGMAAGW